MPEGQSRAEGEQAGSRAEQGPERRGNISVSQSQIPTALTGRGSLHGIASPSGSPRAKSPGYQERWAPSWAVEAVGRMVEGMGREGTQAGWLLSGDCGALCNMDAVREEPRKA